MFCSNCGETLEKEDKFCSKCGTAKKQKHSNEDDADDTNEDKAENDNTDTSNPQEDANTSDKIEEDTTSGCLGCGATIVVFIIIIVMFFSCGTSSDDSDENRSYYDTHDPNDMTNKEMEQYIEWKLKENKREYDNKKFNESN